MNRILKYQSLLAKGWINLEYKRIQRDGIRGWVAVTEKGSEIGPFSTPLSKVQLKQMLSTRYLANVYDDSAHINTRWAMKNPRFHGNVGALDELVMNLNKELTQ